MSPLRIFSLNDVFKIFKELSDIKQFELQRANRHWQDTDIRNFFDWITANEKAIQ